MPFDGLTDDMLRQKAPSIFATHAAPSVSDKYAYLPSYQVVRDMRNLGLVACSAREGKKRQPDGREFALHEVRFRRLNDIERKPELGGIMAEVVMRNSHDRTSGLAVDAGIHRWVCSNGMTVQDDNMGLSFRVRHVGKGRQDELHAGMAKLLGGLDGVLQTAEDWHQIKLTREQAYGLANKAIEAKGTALSIDMDSLLRSRRFLDGGSSLWQVFNRLQENITRGGISGRTATGRRSSLKAISTLVADSDFNRKLWAHASDLAREVKPVSISLPAVA
jgi:hypothetical protein